MKTFFVVNPESAAGKTGRRWAQISAELGKAVGPFGHGFTERPVHAVELARRALHEGYDCVVAVGGDGTVNEVVNGFFEDGNAINPAAALGVLPAGTGGDFRRTFGWELAVPEGARRLARPETRPFDVGLVEYVTPSGEKARRYFANICSFGVSGLVDREVGRASKSLGGRAAFFVGSTRALLQYSDRPVRLKLDGGPAQEFQVTTVAVANGRYFGGGMCVAPDANPSDAQFDVTVWSGFGVTDFITKSASIYSGEHVKLSGTKRFRCKVLEAESAEEVLLDVDGEQPGALPCRVSLLPSAIRLKG
ncbi:MAG: diacylglycerol kinase family lipid kinase [Deltaproteobacteria bacterium]|nr:diacylglycerol kinase family lipid kinase [Deltaproteobacteria bacterium]